MASTIRATNQFGKIKFTRCASLPFDALRKTIEMVNKQKAMVSDSPA